MVPVAFTVPEPPVKRMLYGYVPATDGVPKMVIVLLFHEAATPAGSPLAPAVPAFAIPVAPVVVCVIEVNAVLIQSVGDDEAAPTVFLALKVAMAPDHCELVLMVPPELAVRVDETILSSA